jgi:hypothetical protein
MITDGTWRETLASPRLDRPTDAPQLAPAVVASPAWSASPRPSRAYVGGAAAQVARLLFDATV